MITTLSDFNIPIVSIPDNNIDAASGLGTLLQNSIDTYEPEYMENILGYAMYKAYKAGIDNLDAWAIAFRDGAEYTDILGRLQKWQGFTGNINPIACYVYWNYLRDNQSNVTASGVKMLKVENMTDVSPMQSQVTAWNKMVELNYKMHEYIVANATYFDDYIGFVYSPYFMPIHSCNPNQNLFHTQNIYNF